MKNRWGDRTLTPNFAKYADGLIPAIVVDDRTNQVLMMAYVNQESYQRSLKTRQTWFWSRSRQELWHKGETSGNTQELVSMAIDCDEDTLLMRVIPAGPACHTGHTSCFYRTVLEEKK
ncbi:phosphoribosyl-AMP cyclohydrolase [Lentilactobacillus farraginis]|uniref:phosphoribosyl-AMP cyclohydrolase n=1 Tax=Lentilactobacillus farraginis TaxID=390841 RepID=UPI0009DF73E1|nr:phosphoribosyl-AMP cyclohydrolase [Lentilactobacillus farraginis]